MNSSSKISHSIQIFHILTMILLNMLINVILILTANLRKGGGGFLQYCGSNGNSFIVRKDMIKYIFLNLIIKLLYTCNIQYNSFL